MSWKQKLTTRQLLLAAARKRHEWRPTNASRVLLDKRKRQVDEAMRGIARTSPWKGCRMVTDEIVREVGTRAPVSSRKRTETFGNPGSDHHVSQQDADAVDFAIAEAHWLKNDVSRRLGGPQTLAVFGTFIIERYGMRFRVQIIAGTHGTGPHLHAGVRRA
jgi:hypothetical protein